MDVSLDAIGRDPARLRRLAEASGVHLVMGCGWYRQAYYPPEARIGQRTADDLADELVAEFRRASAGPASGRASSERSGPTSPG